MSHNCSGNAGKCSSCGRPVCEGCAFTFDGGNTHLCPECTLHSNKRNMDTNLEYKKKYIMWAVLFAVASALVIFTIVSVSIPSLQGAIGGIGVIMYVICGALAIIFTNWVNKDGRDSEKVKSWPERIGVALVSPIFVFIFVVRCIQASKAIDKTNKEIEVQNANIRLILSGEYDEIEQDDDDEQMESSVGNINK